MVRWIKTDKHVYGSIYREHHNALSVFSSFTAPDGNPELSVPLPYLLTTWGFRDSAEPLIKSIATKDSMGQKEYDWKYYIASVIMEGEE